MKVNTYSVLLLSFYVCMVRESYNKWCTMIVKNWATLQKTGSFIYISLNHKSAYSVMLRSSKDFGTCKAGGTKWPCIL